MAQKPPSTTRKLVPPGEFQIRDDSLGEIRNENRGLVGERDEQIIDLLNALGQRLIASERERAVLKQTIDRLEDRQVEIESQQEEYAVKIDRAVSMADKIEEAINQQARTNRRIEKMHQERVQMLRKLERIEETVIETSEALHSKALVLLTDQKVADSSGQPRLSADTALVAPKAAPQQERKFWHGQMPLRIMATSAVVLLGAACGWALYNFVPAKSEAPPQIAVIEKQMDDSLTAAQNTAQNTVEEVEIPQPIATAVPIDMSADEAAAIDILNTPEEELNRQFDENPDQLAAALNTIEPGVTEPQVTEEPVVTAALVEETPVVETPAVVEPPVAQQPDTAILATAAQSGEEFVAKIKRETPPLAQRLQPDVSLPPVVKEIENKAFAGNAEAQHDIAAIYTAGHGGVKADYGRAAAWFTEAAGQGVANARYNLGVLYHQGLGVPKDIALAIGWYTAAAALKHPEAQYNLGIAHIEGIGTKYDPPAAAAYFQSAANGGILEAAYNLGLIHENGLLGKIDAEKALYWYKQAADRGSPEALAAMNQLIKSLGIDESQVNAYIGKAAAAMPPPPARGPVTPQAVTPTTTPATAPVKKSAVESLRPEDKIDINEVASYIPAVDETELAHPEATPAQISAKAAQASVNRPVKDRAIVAQVQEQLVRLGLFPGPADGLSGPQTEDAIRSYQVTNNLPGDGRATEALLLHLLTNELNDAPAPSNAPANADEDEYGSRE